MMLDFVWTEDNSDASFVLGECNSKAYRWLQDTRSWPTNHTIITGPSCSGKTHLAHIWGIRNEAIFIRQEGEPLFDQEVAYIIDSLDKIKDEAYLMRFFYQLNKPVLWIASDEYDFENISLPDLRTRLSALIRMKIIEPDEETFKQILRKRCKDFGMNITSETLEYILKRIEITYATVNNFTLLLHCECLKQQKPPTTMMVNSILDNQDFS